MVPVEVVTHVGESLSAAPQKRMALRMDQNPGKNSMEQTVLLVDTL